MIEMPLKIESTLNKREHWSQRAKRAKLHRTVAYQVMKSALPDGATMPCVVRLIRIAPRELDDDNLAGGCKALRDGIADWFGIDDRDPRVRWQYAQAKGKPRQYAVGVEIQPELPL